MATINIASNASQAAQELQTFENQLKASGLVVGDFTTKMVQLNDAGRLARVAVVQFNEVGQQITSTFQRQAGRLVLLNQTYNQSAEAIKAAKNKLDELNKAQAQSIAQAAANRAAAAGVAAASQARAQITLPSAAGFGQVGQYTAAINNLQRVVTATGATQQQVSQLFAQMALGPLAFNQSLARLPSNLQQVGQAMLRVGQAAQQASTGNQSYLLSFQQLGRILESQVFRRGINTIVATLREGIQTAFSTQIIAQQAANLAGQVGPAFEPFRQQVRQVSEEFGTSLEDTFKGAATTVTSQGGDLAAGINVLTNAQKLSIATGTDLGRTTDLLVRALQSYRLTGNDAARVTNAFYNASTNLVIPIETLYAGIGRLGPVAQRLNIPLEQQLALFATLQKNVGNASNSFARLASLEEHIISPSKEVIAQMHAIGVTSAEAFVQQRGILAYLEFLNKIATETPEKLGAAAGGLKGLGAILGTTGTNLAEYGRQLENINRAGQVSAGAQRVQQTPAQQLERISQAIKNVFSQDIGGPLIVGLARIVEGLGGARIAASALIKVLVDGVIVLGTYTVIFRAIIPLINANTAAMASFRSGTILAGSSVALLGGAFTIAITAIVALISYGKLLEEQRVQASVDEINRIKKETEARNEQLRVDTSKQVEAERASISQRFSVQTQATARIVQLAQEARDIQIKHQHEIADAFRVASSTFLDTLRKNVNEARNAIHSTDSEIKSARRSIEEFRTTSQQRLFTRQLGAEGDPRAAIQLIEQRRAQLTRQIQETFANPNASKEQLEAARKMFDELDKLNEELTRREIQRQEQIGQATGRGLKVTYDPQTGQIRTLVQVNLNNAVQRENDLVRFRTQLESQLIERLRQRQQVEERNKATAETNLRIFEAQLRQAEHFSVFNQQGQLQPQYRETERAVQAQTGRRGGGASQALAEFDRIRQQLIQEGRQRGVDVTALTQLLDRRRASLVQEVQSQYELNRATEQNEATIRRINELQDRAKINLEQQEQARRNINNQSSTYQQALGNISERQKGFRGAFTEGEAIPTGALEAARAYNSYLAALQRVQQAQTRFNAQGGQTVENAEELKTSTDQLRSSMEALSRIPADTFRRLLGLFAGKEFSDFIKEAATNARTGAPALQSAASASQQAVTQLELLKGGYRAIQAQIDALSNGSDRINRVLQGIATNVNQTRQPFIDMLNESRTAAGSLAEQLERGQRALEALRAGPINIPQAAAAPAAPNVIGEGAPGFAFGGKIYGKGGIDQIPIWATNGEFIVNADSTKKFYTQLLSINSGVQPRYYAEGGLVTVGDINVTVQGTGSSERTARDTARAINRELRRGTVQFNNLKKK